MRKSLKPTIRTVFNQASRPPLKYLGIIAIAGFSGLVTLQISNAATYATKAETENGVTMGNLGKVTDGGASGGQTVAFGGTDLVAPNHLAAYTGGNSIALVWDMPLLGTVKNVEVYRDNVKVATVTPGTGYLRVERRGTRYIDTNVTRGTTYQYKVRTINNDGGASAYSSTVSARHPTSTTPIPTMTFDTSAAPDVADMANIYARRELEIWYPKLGDLFAYPDYTPDTTLNFKYDTSIGVGGLADHNNIQVNPSFLQAMGTEDKSVETFIHEASHTIQWGFGDTPQEVVEGMASIYGSWIGREYYYVPSPTDNGTITYNPAALGLYWAQTKYNSSFLHQVAIAMHNKTFSTSTIPNLTGGRSLVNLFDEAKAPHYSGPTGTITNANGKCLTYVPDTEFVNDSVTIKPCDYSPGQRWTVIYNEAGLHGTSKFSYHLANLAIHNTGDCLANLTRNSNLGSTIMAQSCWMDEDNTWTEGANGSIMNPKTGRCVGTKNNDTADGTRMVLSDCSISSARGWYWSK